MAHWTIGKQPGFSGILYECSNCGALYSSAWDTDMSNKEICPECGADMDLTENKYKNPIL